MKRKPQYRAVVWSLFCWFQYAAALFAQPRDPDGRSLRFEYISVEHGLSNFALTKIVQDQQGFLWFGTKGSGLCRLDRKKNAFTYFRHDPKNPQSLSNDYVWAVGEDRNGALFVKGILPDARGTLWLSTDKGLSKFNPKNRAFKNYIVKDGLISNQFLSGVYCQGADGRLFFGGEGLGTMKSRAKQLKGALEIFPHPNGGTTVIITAKI